MESKEIKRKIDSVRNIWKLTGALETLSALKMKRAQKIALLSRSFAESVAKILGQINSASQEEKSIFFAEKPAKKVLAVIVASDRGFCGSFNQNVLKFAEKSIKEIQKNTEVDIMPVGKKAISFFKKKEYKIAKDFFGIGDFGELDDVSMISNFLVNSFLEDNYQEVYIFYTNFISTFFQKPKKVRLLPLDADYLKEFMESAGVLQAESKPVDFLIEPDRQKLFEEVVPQLIEYLIYQAILEANAAEHSARMMAMRNASDNAKEQVVELNLAYNKARQEQITNEVCEVSSAKEVLD